MNIANASARDYLQTTTGTLMALPSPPDRSLVACVHTASGIDHGPPSHSSLRQPLSGYTAQISKDEGKKENRS